MLSHKKNSKEASSKNRREKNSAKMTLHAKVTNSAKMTHWPKVTHSAKMTLQKLPVTKCYAMQK